MLITSMSPDRAAVESAANRAAELAGQMAGQVRDASYDGARTERLLQAISGDGDAISVDGERTAEQALMTLDSLYIAKAKAGMPRPGDPGCHRWALRTGAEPLRLQRTAVCCADAKGPRNAQVESRTLEERRPPLRRAAFLSCM